MCMFLTKHSKTDSMSTAQDSASFDGTCAHTPGLGSSIGIHHSTSELAGPLATAHV